MDNRVSDEIRDGYRWVRQDCPTCATRPTARVGKRGGASHREGLGVECEIWRCGRCGLMFADPMPVPVGGLGQHYAIDADEYFESHDINDKLENAAELVRQAEGLLGRKGKLLDVGTGRGEVVAAAQTAGWAVEGVEPSATFADHTEQRTGAKIWREAIEESDIPDEEFDVVILAAVLEHLYDPDAVVAKIARVLRPGGLLYLDVPNESGLFFRVGNLYQKARGRDWCVNLSPTFSPFHIFGFSPRSLKKLLAKYGLEPKVWRVYGGTSMVPAGGGLRSRIESLAGRAVTAVSNLGEMGTYIETWAVKK
jgi:2-polyprenyl-3-methyl-5-hydroxy-6-metoxy-1,4-benzoquinol methylase